MGRKTPAARSNYFRVKDKRRFMQAMKALPGIVTHQNREGAFMLVTLDDWNGCWPTTRTDLAGNTLAVDVADTVARHLKPGQIALLMNAGHEQMIRVGGDAVAVYPGGGHGPVSPADIRAIVQQYANQATAKRMH